MSTDTTTPFVVTPLSDIYATRKRCLPTSMGALMRYADLMRGVDRRPPQTHAELLAQLSRPEIGSVAFYHGRAVGALHLRQRSTWPRLLVSCVKFVVTDEVRQWSAPIRSHLIQQLYGCVCRQAIVEWMVLCDELHRVPFFLEVQNAHYQLQRQFMRDEPIEPARWSTLRQQLFAAP